MSSKTITKYNRAKTKTPEVADRRTSKRSEKTPAHVAAKETYNLFHQQCGGCGITDLKDRKKQLALHLESAALVRLA